jgi:hypothetical protein
MRNLVLLSALVGVLAALGAPDESAMAQQTDPSPAKAGFLMWSAFQCSAFAELAGDKEVQNSKDEQARLFRIGLSAGHAMLNGIRSGTVNIENDVPVEVALSLPGPSDDFRIGRLFDMASSVAFDSVHDAVVERDDTGAMRAPNNWLDGDLKSATAGTKFRNANCGLLR